MERPINQPRMKRVLVPNDVIKDKNGEKFRYNLFDIISNKTPEEIFTDLKELFGKAEEFGFTDVNIQTHEDIYGQYEYIDDLYLTGMRMETDQECAARFLEETKAYEKHVKAQERQEARDRKELERLKGIYEK